MRLEDCVIRNNQAGTAGGGGYAPGYATLTLIRTDFLGNTCPGDGAGLQIYNGTSASLYGCRFIGNNHSPIMASNPTGAGLSALLAGEVLIVNSLFVGNNTAGRGGAISIHEGPATITNSTFAFNTANDVGAIYVTGPGDVTLSNSVVWGNVSVIVGDTLKAEPGSPFDVSTSLVQGGFEGTGNFDADPVFHDAAGPDGVVGTEDDDYRLALSSPALDIADLAALPVDVSDIDGDGDLLELIPEDLASAVRVFGAGLDLGAYETGILFCLPGTFSATGEAPCEPCAPGSAQPNAGGVVCMPCGAGMYAPAEGSASCSSCSEESYQPAIGATACIACDCNDGDPCTTNGCNGMTGSCENDPVAGCTIPAASSWGLVCLGLLLMCAGTIRISGSLRLAM